MKSMFFLLIVLSISFAGIDLTFIDDSGYVAWNLDNEYTYISSISTPAAEYMCNSEELSLSNFSSGGQNYLAIGYTEHDGCGPGHIFVVDPQTMDVVGSRTVSVEEYLDDSNGFGFEQLNLPKYSDITDSYVMMGLIQCKVTDRGYTYPSYIVSSRLDLSDIDTLGLIDTLTAELTSSGYTWTSGPVSSQNIDNLSVSNAYLWQPYQYPDYIRMRSHLHQMVPSRADSMLTHCFCLCGPFESIPYFNFALLGLGSNSTECLTLWADTTNTVFSTVFTDSIVPQSTSCFPFQHPGHDDAVALSCNPDDPGMLMVWYEPSTCEIRARHYQNLWNDYDHIVADCPTSVEKGNITVYSVDDGYWVAWLRNGEDYPELEYIDRSMVTAISHEGETPDPGGILSVSTNPFRGSVTIGLEVCCTVTSLRVFDMAGRSVRNLQSIADGIYLWNGCDESGSRAAAGIYLLRAETDEGNLTARLVKLP